MPTTQPMRPWWLAPVVLSLALMPFAWPAFRAEAMADRARAGARQQAAAAREAAQADCDRWAQRYLDRHGVKEGDKVFRLSFGAREALGALLTVAARPDEVTVRLLVLEALPGGAAQTLLDASTIPYRRIDDVAGDVAASYLKRFASVESVRVRVVLAQNTYGGESKETAWSSRVYDR